ncbi:hypothetical protein SCE1572_15905 [Sorangium cellulosum So0157-2]|uniref:Uncharacterized protein n=1 Tax=Sorangium cellulosum So0157-2 TaxID=1254432 RepID=S4XTJ0_SORCE|nr:hypothetical protein SCE1572_15905 [Sorangium cellulosum So0157-2]
MTPRDAAGPHAVAALSAAAAERARMQPSA